MKQTMWMVLKKRMYDVYRSKHIISLITISLESMAQITWSVQITLRGDFNFFLKLLSKCYAFLFVLDFPLC